MVRLAHCRGLAAFLACASARSGPTVSARPVTWPTSIAPTGWTPTPSSRRPPSFSWKIDMAIELKMPALSPTMEKGTLVKWLVVEGDMVKPGDLIAEIETDKATMEYEAIDEGRVASLVVAEGTDDVAAGTVIALLTDGGEAPPEPVMAGAAQARNVPPPAVAPEPASPAASPT